MTSVVSLARIGLSFVLLAVVAGSASTEPLVAPCKVADQYLSLQGKLDRAAAHLKDGDPFRILVVGSSSTAGVGATQPARSYTKRLETELELRLPGVDVDVVAKGIGGETSLGAEARMAKEVAAAKPDLVIWQIGTNDVYRKIDLATFTKTAREGLADIAAAGVDVALMDPQYVPQDEAAYSPYLEAITKISSETGVPVARRFDAMRAVAKAGGAAMISKDKLHMNDEGHACVGAFLAEALDRKLAPTPPAIAQAQRQG